MSVFNKITAGFELGQTDPITSGLEDLLFVWNRGDIIIQYSPTNPLLITGFIPVNGANIYQFTGTNNSFNSVSKQAMSDVGPRYTEELDFNIAGNTTALKTQMMAMGYGRMQAIAVNNWKTGDSVVELYGAENGLILTDAERSSQDETLFGGYKLKLTNPNKIKEPYPPRSVVLTPTSGTASYAYTIATLLQLAL